MTSKDKQQQARPHGVVEKPYPATSSALDLQFYKSLIDLLPEWKEHVSEGDNHEKQTNAVAPNESHVGKRAAAPRALGNMDPILVEERKQRQPLASLKSNHLFDSLQDVADAADDDSLTTSPSLEKNENASKIRQSWAIRMSQALKAWKEQHEQWTEKRLSDQQKQLRAEHAQELRDVRDELHRYYQQEFLAWKMEYLSSLKGATKQTLTPLGTQPTTPCTADCDTESSSLHSRRQRWQSPDGKLITRYHNGARLEKSPDGSTVTRFVNGDVQTTGSLDSPTKLCYYYGSTGTLRMDQVDGSVIWCFPSGQRERHYPDGRVQVTDWAVCDKERHLKNANV